MWKRPLYLTVHPPLSLFSGTVHFCKHHTFLQSRQTEEQKYTWASIRVIKINLHHIHMMFTTPQWILYVQPWISILIFINQAIAYFKIYILFTLVLFDIALVFISLYLFPARCRCSLQLTGTSCFGITIKLELWETVMWIFFICLAFYRLNYLGEIIQIKKLLQPQIGIPSQSYYGKQLLPLPWRLCFHPSVCL